MQLYNATNDNFFIDWEIDPNKVFVEITWNQINFWS